MTENSTSSGGMLCTENWMMLSELAKRVPPLNGRRLNTATLWRRCRKGVHGVRLEYRRLGGRIVTSLEALDRFGKALADLDAQQPVGPRLPEPRPTKRRSPKARERDMAAARAELREHGVGAT